MNTAHKHWSDEEVLAFLSGFDPQVQAIALGLRALVFDVYPQAIEQIDQPARLLGYGSDRTYKGTLFVIMPLKSAVNLGFARGASLPDPVGLLAGTGKRARHVKVAHVDQVGSPDLRALLEAALNL
jgi:hypothetical protein